MLTIEKVFFPSSFGAFSFDSTVYYRLSLHKETTRIYPPYILGESNNDVYFVYQYRDQLFVLPLGKDISHDRFWGLSRGIPHCCARWAVLSMPERIPF